MSLAMGSHHYIFIVKDDKLTEKARQGAAKMVEWTDKIKLILDFGGVLHFTTDGRKIEFAGTAERYDSYCKQNSKTKLWQPDKRTEVGKKITQELKALGPFIKQESTLIKERGWEYSCWIYVEGKTYIPSTRLLGNKDFNEFYVLVPKPDEGDPRLKLVLDILRKQGQEISYGVFYDHHREQVRTVV